MRLWSKVLKYNRFMSWLGASLHICVGSDVSSPRTSGCDNSCHRAQVLFGKLFEAFQRTEEFLVLAPTSHGIFVDFLPYLPGAGGHYLA